MDLEEVEDVNLEGEDIDERSESNGNEEDMAEEEGDEEGQQFDISLAAEHSYMGPELSTVGGRVVLEAGWTGRVPSLAHHGVVFPGETVPMLLTNDHDAQIIADTLQTDKLFGLLCPDETSNLLSGYGVLCEVFEAALSARRSGSGGRVGEPPSSVSFKARAVHRFRLKDMSKRSQLAALYVRLRYLEVVVLPEVEPTHPLQHARLAALDSRRRPGPHAQQEAAVRRLDAALTPWPQFVYEIFDYTRMRNIIQHYFNTIGGLERVVLPSDAVALSFWVASNLAVSARDRLALLVCDNALLRLHMECRYIARKSVLCCATCGSEVARHEHALAMSTDGTHSNYTNPGGFVHDVVTVSRAVRVRCAGSPSLEYSWFPGYAWSVCVCARCAQHVGWRFEAHERALRPRTFYALCRNYVVPRDVVPRRFPDTPPL